MATPPPFHPFDSFYIKYPHLGAKLHSTWGTSTCRAILKESLLADRDGRAGFPPDDAKILFSLLEKHDKIYPHLNPEDSGDLPFKIATIPRKIVTARENDTNLSLFFIKVMVGFVILLVSIKEFLILLK